MNDPQTATAGGSADLSTVTGGVVVGLLVAPGTPTARSDAARTWVTTAIALGDVG
jgi:hypothetical protein